MQMELLIVSVKVTRREVVSKGGCRSLQGFHEGVKRVVGNADGLRKGVKDLPENSRKGVTAVETIASPMLVFGGVRRGV